MFKPVALYNKSSGSTSVRIGNWVEEMHGRDVMAPGASDSLKARTPLVSCLPCKVPHRLTWHSRCS